VKTPPSAWDPVVVGGYRREKTILLRPVERAFRNPERLEVVDLVGVHAFGKASSLYIGCSICRR
jgi:hypothetical protein